MRDGGDRAGSGCHRIVARPIVGHRSLLGRCCSLHTLLNDMVLCLTSLKTNRGAN